jgi:phage terminase small subunit
MSEKFIMNMEQRQAFEQLTPNEQLYAAAIISGSSRREACRKSGVKMQTGHRPAVRKFLTMVSEELLSDAVMSRAEAMERLTTIARTSITDVVDVRQVNWGTDEEPDIQTMWQLRNDEEALSSVQKLSAGPSGPKIELYSSLQAIRQMSDMCGWAINEDVGALEAEGRTFDVQALSNDTLHELVMVHYANTERE